MPNQINFKNLVIFVCCLCILTSCAEVIEKSIANKTIIVNSPVNNLISTDSLQTFHWDQLEGATSYQLQIVSPDFDSIARFIADTTIQINFFFFPLNPGKYQWRVSAFNQNTATPFSDPRNLFVN
jgi:hypothetical protein